MDASDIIRAVLARVQPEPGAPLALGIPSSAPPAETTTDLMERKFGPAPPALRLFAQTLAGDRGPIDASHFKPRELDALRTTAENALAQGKTSFGYGDYGERDPWAEGNRAVVNALTDPAQSLAFTLGMANTRRGDDGGVVINDNYHWAAKPRAVDEYRSISGVAKMLLQGAVQNGLLGIGNVIGNFVAPQGEGRKVEIKIPPKTE